MYEGLSIEELNRAIEYNWAMYLKALMVTDALLKAHQEMCAERVRVALNVRPPE